MNANRRKPKLNKPRRKKHRSHYEARLGLIILVALALFIGYFMLKDSFFPILLGTVQAEAGSTHKTIKAEAILVRRENVMISPAAGKIEFCVKQGERVRAGTVIGRVSQEQALSSVNERLSEVRDEITAYEKQNKGEELSLTNKAIASAENATSIIQKIREATAFGNAGEMVKHTKTLSGIALERASAMAQLDVIEQGRSRLVLEEKRLLELLDKAGNEIRAPEPGVVTFEMDGGEGGFTMENLPDLTPRSVFTFEDTVSRVEDGSYVKPAQVLCKIVGTSEQFMFVAVPLEAGIRLSKKAAVAVEVDGETGVQFTGTIEGVSEENPRGYVGLVIKVPAGVEMISGRKHSVSIVEEIHDGCLVPRSALVTRGGRKGVYISYKTIATFKEVEVLSIDGNTACVRGIEPGSIVIRNGFLAWEGARVR